jgi:hypothetical protein
MSEIKSLLITIADTKPINLCHLRSGLYTEPIHVLLNVPAFVAVEHMDYFATILEIMQVIILRCIRRQKCH